jgi:putative aminopeptidase FrvX
MYRRIISVALCVFVVVSFVASDAEESSVLKLAETLFPVPCPTGYEEPMVKAIQGILSSDFPSHRDNLGGFYWNHGKENSQLAVCTPMDETGYFISGINPQGYLRIGKAVFGLPLIDSYHLGHPMIVWTEKGPIEGVLALPSLHILSSDVRRTFQERPGLELAYLDIGVNSVDEVREKGVSMMDAVTPWRELTRLAGDQLAGHSLGLKLCNALVLDLAKNHARPGDSNTVFVWMAQTKSSLRRARLRSSLGAFRAAEELKTKNIIIVDILPCDAEDGKGIVIGDGPVLVYSGDKAIKLRERILTIAQNKGISLQIAPNHTSPVMNPFLPKHDEVIGLFLPVKFSQTPSEVVDAEDAETLRSLLNVLLKEGGL